MKSALLGILLFTCTSCVSVALGPGAPQRASGVRFSAPAKPFEKASAEHVDGTWRDSANGNAISYLSECNDPSDPTLHAIEQGVLSGLYPYSYVTQADTTYEGRAARRVQVKGIVDGVPSLVDLLIFKRNNCLYILSYVGLEQHHQRNQKAFEDFISGFHAP
jgi:hypothetical protein